MAEEAREKVLGTEPVTVFVKVDEGRVEGVIVAAGEGERRAVLVELVEAEGNREVEGMLDWEEEAEAYGDVVGLKDGEAEADAEDVGGIKTRI